jgi:hypothetical protein
VDRLLAAPAYGERMAMDWLDVARFADTYGYQADRPSHLWPWRDWVIRAFNDNLPYDQFILWQLAGDLLPAATQDQVLATAFNRLHRQTNEGGSVLEEMRQEYIADRVHTFGTAFLGMTFECARCHDHKFDPIPQRDYYSVAAFFGNIDESGMYAHYTDAVPTPAAMLYQPGEAERHAALRKQIRQAEEALSQAHAAALPAYQAWLESKEARAEMPRPVLHLPLDEATDGTSPDAARDRPAVLVGAPALPEFVEGHAGRALRFDGDNALDAPGAGDFARHQPFTVAAWIQAPAFLEDQVVLHHSMAREDAGSRGWALLLQHGHPVFRLAHFWPGNALEVRATAALPLNTWTHVTATYDGSSRAEGLRLYVNGMAVELAVVRDDLVKDIRYEGERPPGLRLAARSRDTGFKDGAIDEVMLFDVALAPVEVESLAGATRLYKARIDARRAESPAEHPMLEHYLARVDPAVAEARGRLDNARAAERDFAQGIRQIMVMREMAEPRPTHLLARGAYDAPTERVTPGVPEAILPYGDELPPNRLGLAQWLLAPDHPLTARVAVNRYWQIFFGRGLVETQEDFGSQGAAPDHPELLDALARWFVAQGWDVKALARLIVTSATYRQDTAFRPELAERDPENRLLARGPGHPLAAEQIRDQAMAASGLLVPTIGGPSVKPYQPAGLWEEASWDSYKQDTGEALYRRAMYTFWKRTVPPPAMLTLDATSREVCVARRERTQTPLQSLVLLNDPTYVEAARALAARLLHEQDDDTARLGAAFLLLTGRRPDARESEILALALREQHEHFARDPAGAAAYVRTGESPADELLDPVAHAALTALVQAVMNHDEAQRKT